MKQHKITTVRFEQEEFEKIKSCAKSNGYCVSSFVRWATKKMCEYFEERDKIREERRGI